MASRELANGPARVRRSQYITLRKWWPLGVTRADEASDAVDAGTSRIDSPGLVTKVLEQRDSPGVPVSPGILTPSEAMASYELDANSIIVFPAPQSGPTYLKRLLPPRAEPRSIPTGRVALDETLAYPQADAVAMGLGNSLASPTAAARRDWTELRRPALDAVILVHGSAA